MRKVAKLAKYFQRKLANTMYGGKDYILQKEDGTLIVDGVTLDRDELNAMQSWQDMVDMGVSKSTVGKIALEYGGKPQNVDFWLEQNSTPFSKKDDDSNDLPFSRKDDDSNDPPSHIDENGTKHWFNNKGELHRECGPAIEYSDGGREYYIDGQEVSEDEWRFYYHN